MRIKPITEHEVRLRFKIQPNKYFYSQLSYYMNGYNDAVRKFNNLCDECFITCGYCGTKNKYNNNECKHCNIKL